MSDAILWRFPDVRTLELTDRKKKKEYATSLIYASMRSQPKYAGYTVGEDTAFRLWTEACVQVVLSADCPCEIHYDPLHDEVTAHLFSEWISMDENALAGLAPLATVSHRIEFSCKEGKAFLVSLFSFRHFSDK